MPPRTGETAIQSQPTPPTFAHLGDQPEQMSLSVKHINADSSFLLTFSPPWASKSPSAAAPGSFTILIDPWLSGPSKIWMSKFALTYHAVPACVESLAELPEPDVVLISQDKTDHCHKETLLQLERDCSATILATPAAAKKIKGWNHFDPDCIQSLKTYNEKREDTVYRIAIPPISPSGSPGEVTISLLTSRTDLTGLHNAIGITYRAPSSVLSYNARTYIKLKSPTEPENNISRPTTPTPNSTSAGPSVLGNVREKTVSVLYSPHGVSYNVIKPYAASHLLSEAALPLTALLHSFDRASNPWYLGGNICAGTPGGSQIARNLFVKSWISAHDEPKKNTGVAVLAIKIDKFAIPDIEKECNKATRLITLNPGEEHIIAAR